VMKMPVPLSEAEVERMKIFLRRHRAFEFLRDISRREAGADDLVRGGCRNSRHSNCSSFQSPHGLSLRFAPLPRCGDCGEWGEGRRKSRKPKEAEGKLGEALMLRLTT
jgi:hypothetical protein